jgi:RNA polymerase sigma-70 factor (ECF subfamily)
VDGGIRHRRFETTRWSVVLAAVAGGPSAGADEALATLCESYWYPLYAFLRSRGYSAEDAQD